MRYRLSENSLRLIIRDILVEKKWADLNAPKGKVISLSPSDFEADECLEPPCPDVRDLDDEIFELIQNAYSDVEIAPAFGDEPATYGNIKVQSPADLPGRYTIMKAADLDSDPDPDYFRGGKDRGGRFKLGIVGHDGSAAAIQKYLDETAEDLRSGAIGEMSGKIANIMISRYGVPAVTSKEEVESLLGKPVDWIGRHPVERYASKYGPGYEGFYSRAIAGPGQLPVSGGGHDHVKILLGGT